MDAELERILADDYLDDLSSMPVDDIRSRRGECQAVETQLSYLRRLVQGRHDIVTGEIDRRSGGGDRADVSDLVERLPQILADRIHAPGPGRLPAAMEPGELSGRLVDQLAEIADGAGLDAPDTVDDDTLTQAAHDLGDLEHEVSTLRRAMFDRIDTLQAELTRRYREGETTVDDLLHR